MIRNELTNEELSVPADVLTNFVANLVRSEKISKLEQASTADLLDLPEQHPAVRPRKERIASKTSPDIVWFSHGPPTMAQLSSLEGWYVLSVKEQWQGPFSTETLAIEEFNKRHA